MFGPRHPRLSYFVDTLTLLLLLIVFMWVQLHSLESFIEIRGKGRDKQFKAIIDKLDALNPATQPTTQPTTKP